MDSLPSVISEIINSKSVFATIYVQDELLNYDSITEAHQKLIIKYSNQETLELVLDTTNSPDLKFYCAQALV
ncbi:MAG: hypothetical protein ABF240_10345, partial [Flavobacteriales bacterium]